MYSRTGSTDKRMHVVYTHQIWQTQTPTKQVTACEGWVRHMEFEPLNVKLGKQFFSLVNIFQALKTFSSLH